MLWGAGSTFRWNTSVFIFAIMGLANRTLGVASKMMIQAEPWALQVVALAEQRGVAAAHGGLAVALASGDGAQAVEPPCDGGDEPALAVHVRGDGPEERRGGLVRAVGAAQPLDCLVGAPSGLQQVMDAPLGVCAGEISVIAAPGAARHGEHQDALGPVYERCGLGEIDRSRPAAQRETPALPVHDAQ